MPTINRNISGADLRAARKAAKVTQADLAKRVGVSRDTVQYWEAKAQIGWHGAWRLMAEALGLQDSWPSIARTGGWGVSWREQADAQAEALFAVYLARAKEREAQRLACHRVICGAKTRKGGQCRNKSEPGKSRCKFHGGKSTGAKTPEGLERIAEAQRRRWARMRGGGAITPQPRNPVLWSDVRSHWEQISKGGCG
ncbi:helix-turn-helix transcriptional regulator [Cypionkella sp.]|uniref:helix-turn-helix domain-containing protein n=1 Tax=Cypionkella sp. TaxID=2811411 RepID=UPI00271CEC03|nr:helix-turn-helix transcriptional regulator [Cypionkella sp.]MDO8982864.1 helix-turn-helix transcriptional regulator [Cypionkella sp.]MDP2049612.1 helix-turn-helix transcriptional regulator [Cypionkella sp.]